MDKKGKFSVANMDINCLAPKKHPRCNFQNKIIQLLLKLPRLHQLPKIKRPIKRTNLKRKINRNTKSNSELCHISMQ